MCAQLTLAQRFSLIVETKGTSQFFVKTCCLQRHAFETLPLCQYDNEISLRVCAMSSLGVFDLYSERAICEAIHIHSDNLSNLL